MKNFKIQSLERAFSILELFRYDRPELSIKEIADSIDLPKATLYRFISDLETARFLEQDSLTKKYKLGLKLLEFGNIVQDSIDIRKKAFPYLENLRVETNENVNLGVIDQTEIVYLERLETVRLFRMDFRVGSKVPIHSSSIGKILLGLLPEGEKIELLDKLDLKAYTKRTITDKDLLLEELENVRKQNYSISNRELFEEVRTVAVPIYNHLGKVIAACNVSASYERLPYELIQTKVLPLLKITGEEISRSLGFTGSYQISELEVLQVD